MKSIKLKSTSKVNLALWVKKKRRDGYHEIETIFYENQYLYDNIEIVFSKNSKLSIECIFSPGKLNRKIQKNNNTAFMAAKLFF